MARSTTRRVLWLRVGLVAWDIVCWAAAAFTLTWARYDFTFSVRDLTMLGYLLALAAPLQVIAGFVSKLYRGRHNLGSTEEIVTLTVITAIIGVTVGVVVPLVRRVSYGYGLLVLAPVGALLLQVAGRFVWRSISNQTALYGRTRRAEKVIVYGAGNAGQQLAALIQNDPDSGFDIVGFIDDDPDKQNLRFLHNRVIGSRDDLVRAAQVNGASTVIVAIPTASRQFMQSLSAITDREGLRVLVMPNTRDIVGGRVQLGQLHQLDVADLLGRAQIKTDVGEIAGYLQGKTVLVTGAGGSIGSEIARQVYRFGPKDLVMLDRDESLLHSTQLSIFNQGLLDTPNMVLCDIRDAVALNRVFADHRPDVVFHAAALKHLPMLEQYPAEGWKTNALGSANVLAAAERHGVERYVNISTDKAADASSVLGKTKRIAEELTAWYAGRTGRTFLSVRFGNVLGSRGSALLTFTSQIDRGGPITVTHPDMTRYFMTIPEACELVIQAGAIGKPGDVLVLDMGQPVKILDVAKGLIARSGKDIDIIFTGLRPNEKLHEVLFSGDEASTPTSHPLINRVEVPPLDPGLLASVDGADPESMATLTHQRNARAAAQRNAELAARVLDESAASAVTAAPTAPGGGA